MSDEEKAGWVVRTMVIDRAYDVGATCWTLSKDRPGWHWGVYREDFTPKVGYVALAALSALACDRPCRAVCEGDDATYHYCFEYPGDPQRLHVVWNLLGAREHRVDLARDATLLDLCGNVQDTLAAGSRSVAIATVPRYVLETGGYP